MPLAVLSKLDYLAQHNDLIKSIKWQIFELFLNEDIY